MNKLKAFLETAAFVPFQDDVIFDAPLKDRTSFKIGGPADALFCPQNYTELLDGLNFFALQHVPVSVLGGGTNLLISDAGVEGVVLSLKNFTQCELLSDTIVHVEAGVLTEVLSRFAAENSLAGFENFAALPGTVGGALFMNARCYESEISACLEKVQCIKLENGRFTPHTYTAIPSDWGYKISPFQKYRNRLELGENADIIVSATFRLQAGNRAELEKIRQARTADRIKKGHFLKPSCGSTFKNNRTFGKPSGVIIEEAGLKGASVGGAEVASFHANFIVNNGSATASDVKALIEVVQKKVKEKTGFTLEPEVIFAGRFQSISKSR